jgi:MoaA/NifB/PqqE/SkfB family radical SAM enzyme
VCVSIDGIKETDQIRGIRRYFDLGFEGMRLLKHKKVAISVTLNRLSANELQRLAAMAKEVGAGVFGRGDRVSAPVTEPHVG